MGRPREFEIDAALQAAMQVFWRKGYEGASLPELLNAMGIARGSFYKAFPDKRSVYLSALERYHEQVVSPAVRTLAATPDGADAIADLLRNASRLAAEEERRGCLLCNASSEHGGADKEVQARLLAMHREIEDGLSLAVARTHKGRTLTHAQQREEAGRLNALYIGLRIMARAGYPASELDALINQATAPFR